MLTELGRLSRSALGTPQGGIISPLLANLALSILDEPFQAAWEATSRYRNQRSYLRSKGVATYRLVRYSDDFVILVNGTREQAEFLRADTAALLARHGLRLSEARHSSPTWITGSPSSGSASSAEPGQGKPRAPTPSCPGQCWPRPNGR